ncbi:hypothetical protein V6O07_03625, partial [Arthrospira platensis SPKY2]
MGRGDQRVSFVVIGLDAGGGERHGVSLGLAGAVALSATVSGFVLNWLWVAPRLMRASRSSDAITLTEFLAGPEAREGWPRRVVVLASGIVLFSFTFYIAAQFQAAGGAFASA